MSLPSADTEANLPQQVWELGTRPSGRGAPRGAGQPGAPDRAALAFRNGCWRPIRNGCWRPIPVGVATRGRPLGGREPRSRRPCFSERLLARLNSGPNLGPRDAFHDEFLRTQGQQKHE